MLIVLVTRIFIGCVTKFDTVLNKSILDSKDSVCNNRLNKNKLATIRFLCYDPGISGNMRRFPSQSLEVGSLFSGDTYLSLKIYETCEYELVQF
jgi:hypothetical protein